MYVFPIIPVHFNFRLIIYRAYGLLVFDCGITIIIIWACEVKKRKEKIMSDQKMSKSQFIEALAEKSGINKKQATMALDTINTIVAEQLGKKGPGEVIIPGLLKINVVEKPATPEHEGINPFTKERMTFKAKPARKVVKAHPLKALKDAI